jgi:hypothetical protein
MRKAQLVSEDHKVPLSSFSNRALMASSDIHPYDARNTGISPTYRIVSDGLQRRSAGPLDDFYTDLLVHVLALRYDASELSRCPQQRDTASGLSVVCKKHLR